MTDVMTQLRRIDPLPADAEPRPLAEMLEMLDPDVRPLQAPVHELPVRARPRRFQAAFVLAGVAAASLAAALALSDFGGGRLDVAAAAYRATETGSGVLHMSIDSERKVGSVTSSTTVQLWSAQNPRRMRTIHTDAEGTLEGSLTTTPVRQLTWSSSQPSVIEESSPSGVSFTESSPVQIIHRLLGERRATVNGPTSFEGHEAWELQIHPQTAPESFEGAQVPTPTLIVAKETYVPLELVMHYVTSEKGKPELAEQRERYVEYQELPAGRQSEALLELAPHSGAKVQKQG